MQLADKTAIITGSGNGIGAAIADRFVREGARVVVTDIDEAAGTAFAEKLNATGRAMFERLDVLSSADWEKVVSNSTAAFGPVDILVNNAGVYERIDVLETDEQDWDRIMDINAKGTVLMCHAAVEQMRQPGGGNEG